MTVNRPSKWKMNDPKIAAEKLANKLKIRILELAQNPAPKRYEIEPQPEMMPAVYWPMEWLVEVIATAMQPIDDCAGVGEHQRQEHIEKGDGDETLT